MGLKQTQRAPKLQTVQHTNHESTSPLTPEAISLHRQDQAVEEKQSYATVTGLLQLLVARIAYQRDLFPKSCFEMQLPSLIRTEAHRSYEQADAGSNLINGDNEMAHFATALAQRDQPFVTLTPGKTNGVDKLLAWLDVIFKGLLDRSLDGVQFSIYADKSKPSQPLELYTFSFTYRDGEDGERWLTGLTAPGHGGGISTTRSVGSAMVNVIDQLNNYQQQLPVLPKERYLMCHLFHSPSAPRHHRTPGFHTCTDINMAVIEDGLWYMKQRSFGSIDTGFHRMRLGIDFMARTDAAKNLDLRPALAQNMEYTRTVSRTLKPDVERHIEIQTAPPVNTRMVTHPRGFTQADEQGDLMTLKSPQGGTKMSGRSRVMRRSMSPGPLSKDFGESVRIHNTLSGDSLLPTQVMETHDPSALLAWNWKLRAAKSMEMGVKRERKQWISDQDNRVVRCECSCDQEESLMLRCICCQKLQHYHCYGFALKTHVYEHHCYQCLLEDTHESLLGDMKSIAIFRRALWILYEKAPSSPAEFAQKLHFDGKTTQGLIKRLDEGGYLASGRTRLSPVTTLVQLEYMSQLYHNPLTSIGRFYEPREDTQSANTVSEDGRPRHRRADHGTTELIVPRPITSGGHTGAAASGDWYSSEKLTQSSRLREAIDAVQRMYDNRPESDDLELVQIVAERGSSWIALRGWFSDLRPEDATGEDHSNKYIQRLRDTLWTPERLQAYRRGIHTYKSLGYRPDQQEKTWRQRVSWGQGLPDQLKIYDTEVRIACAYLDHLDDPRVGSSQKAEILAADLIPEQGAVKPDRAIDEQILDSVLLKGIDKSVHNLKGHSPPSEYPDVRDARHILI